MALIVAKYQRNVHSGTTHRLDDFNGPITGCFVLKRRVNMKIDSHSMDSISPEEKASDLFADKATLGDNQQDQNRDVRRPAAVMDTPQMVRQQALPRHAVEQA